MKASVQSDDVLLAALAPSDLAQGDDDTVRFLLTLSSNSRNRLLLAFLDHPSKRKITLTTLDALCRCFVPCIILNHPKLDIVPLLHDTSALRSKHVGGLLGENKSRRVYIKEGDGQLVEDMKEMMMDDASAGDNEENFQIVEVLRVPPASIGDEEEEGSVARALQNIKSVRVIGEYDPDHELRFDTVACGGTFDRLHAGHRLLLAATAIVARRSIFVGITTDKLLENKRHADLLQTYEEREATTLEYLKSVNPSAKVVAGPLHDAVTPPLAATDPDFQAIVVSEETIDGAEKINAVRASLGFQPLVIVVIGLLGTDDGHDKLSSTHLREIEASRAH